MRPAGYMLKKIANRPEWIQAESVVDVCSLSNCISASFADYIKFWKHNANWLFDSPELLQELTDAEQIDRSALCLFYYEVFEKEFDEETKQWSTIHLDPSIPTEVREPQEKQLLGFDLTSFSVGTSPECSPLSCNGLSKDIAVNQHCLFNTFEEAVNAVESGKFANSEPGPFRIFAVYRI